MADCINFPFHGDSSRVFENLMQSAILFLAVKVAKVGPEYWVQPSPDSAVYLKINAISRVFEMADCINFDFSPCFPVYYSIEFIFQARNLDSHHKE